MSRKSSTETLAAAMRALARDIQSGDGVANAAIAEAAERLEEQQARIAELEQANSQVILDSSNHVRDTAKMVTDRRLADAVNDLRDIAIKYHAAGQLRERIAGVVHGLVRGESATASVDDSQLLDDLELVAREYMTGFSVVYRHACEGEPGGFVAMRRHHRTEPAPTLREAVGLLLAGGE